MICVGLDLSLSSTGLYIINTDKGDTNAEIKTKPADYLHDIHRCDAIANIIMSMIQSQSKIDMIALEDYFTGKQPGTVIKLAILGTIVRYHLLKNGFPFVAFAPTQIKKFETGSGISPKDNMLKSVFKKHGFDTSSNNVADACAIAHLGKAYFEYTNNKRDFLKYELEVLDKINSSRVMEYPYSLVEEKNKNK